MVYHGDEADLFSERTRQIRTTFTDGDCLYYLINDLSNGAGGRSKLLAQIDWLDAYDDFMFGEMDRSKFLRAFF